MVNHKRHLFHLVNPSPWPFLVSIAVFLFASGFGFYMHRIEFGGWVCLLGFISLLIISFFWFRDIVEEASFVGHHTKVVQKGLILGFYFFIASEIMLFFGFFWAFFHSSFSPSEVFGDIWPPVGIVPIVVWDFPLFNTFLLIISGFCITWAHKAVLNSLLNVIDALIVTIILGYLFVILQGLEYYESTFNFDDSVYSCTFFMLTGLHGLHVFVGVNFILVCLIRFFRRHFTKKHHLGFLFALWYWHFVDIVWILLFLTVYGWGSW